MILNPNCSTIVCALPTYSSIKAAEKMLADIYKSDMDQKVKDDLKDVLYEWSYDNRQEVCTESYPDGTLEVFIDSAQDLKNHIKNIKDFPEPRYVDNLGGGGHWELVEQVWIIAKLVAFGKITMDEAINYDKNIGGQELTDECRTCLKKGKLDKDCTEYVRRVVGECQGKFKKSTGEQLRELEREVVQECSTKL